MKSEPFSFRRLLGEILLTAGLLIVLFVFYEAFWTNVKSGQLQAQANERMEQRWQETGGGVPVDGVAEPESGQAFSRIYIPRLGADYEYAVLAGTSQDVLAAGPGHYVDTHGARRDWQFCNRWAPHWAGGAVCAPGRLACL